MKHTFVSTILALGLWGILLNSGIALGSVESTLTTIQTKLISVVLPLASILGILFAGFTFVMGSPSAKRNLFLAIIGAAIGFGAPQIMVFVRGMVN